ncbi:MAG: multifunctional CCA addition/repair protein, partial [Proteobacteria bacterium]|nr:multifunctional CCA addition/repair protein [Burkholderiales bacterium]
MRVYSVGGSVRDQLLGLPVVDRDWVVVGATPPQLIDLGYRPVGRDFPVFLHPVTHEEYALARTERKSAPGYRGFIVHAAPEVTLEEDLARRDLTINAIACDESGALVDPFHGQRDIEARVLRHVGPAFSEDPVRILRLARFAARFDAFSVAPETRALARAMVDAGEVDALVAERVWQELAKGLSERSPSRMFAVLRDCGALARILPEVDRLFGVPQPAQHHPEIDTGVHVMSTLDLAARESATLPVRFALLMHDLGKGTTPAEEWPRHIAHEQRGVPLIDAVCDRLRVPAECCDLARLVARFHTDVHRALELKPSTMLRVIERCDGLRRPERFAQVLEACEYDARGRAGLEARAYPQ